MPTTTVLSDLKRNVEDIVGEADLIERLGSGRRLRIKYGVDCTAPDLHIGHAVNLWMMRSLQDLGHRVVFLLGDVTTRIGDPTGRSTTRPELSEEEITANAAAFLAQVSMVLRTDPEVFEVRRNSEWFASMPAPDLLRLLSMVTHAQMMSRDMFRERVAHGRELALHELAYPVLQGYDSVAMDSDLTIVGSDQLFNEMMGRHFQSRLGQAPQVVITTTITPGLDGGPKQSKSMGNYIALTEDPKEQFGKLMSLPDDLVGAFARAYTDLALHRVAELAEEAAGGGTGARDAKLRVAQSVVARYHGADEGRRQRAEFLRVFAAGSEPADIPALSLTARELTVRELLALAEPTLGGNERRRLIAQGAVRLDGRVLADPDDVLTPAPGAVLRVGKRRWHRVGIAGSGQPG